MSFGFMEDGVKVARYRATQVVIELSSGLFTMLFFG
jgi:hypothetical protein